MRRRDFLTSTSAVGLGMMAASLPSAITESATKAEKKISTVTATVDNKLTPPSKGKIPVAFLISRGVTVIDFAGPWEVFQDVQVPTRGTGMEDQMPFRLFTVSDTTETITATAGLNIVPNYTFETAPAPKVIVIPAQGGRTPAMFQWLNKASRSADVVMSVCTGAFILARTGMLSGKAATTHHDFLESFAKEFPDVEVKRGRRFVEGPKISSAGGLTSGIDLALRVVERYFGRDVARATAAYMEYQSEGWII
jgi:transcriptional regulator GlxA family with amidase domain